MVRGSGFCPLADREGGRLLGRKQGNADLLVGLSQDGWLQAAQAKPAGWPAENPDTSENAPELSHIPSMIKQNDLGHV